MAWPAPTRNQRQPFNPYHCKKRMFNGMEIVTCFSYCFDLIHRSLSLSPLGTNYIVLTKRYLIQRRHLLPSRSSICFSRLMLFLCFLLHMAPEGPSPWCGRQHQCGSSGPETRGLNARMSVMRPPRVFIYWPSSTCKS